MMLSIIIPVFNEERTIRSVLDKVRRQPFEKEIIVVNDGSTDRTGEILHSAWTEEIVVLCNRRNMGKGAAVRLGIKHARGDIILIQDADLEYNPDDYGRLTEPIILGRAEVVYGARMVVRRKDLPSVMSYTANKVLTLVANLLYNARLTDISTCYKVFSSNVLKSLDLRSTGFEFCEEVTAKVLRKGVRIQEVPVSYFPRGYREGKKIGWRDGIIAMLSLLKYRLIA